jgi:dihydroorotate dehydrogenase electron transfer subunit
LRAKRCPIAGRAHELTDGQGIRRQSGRPHHSQLAENKPSSALVPAASLPSPAMLLEYKGLVDIHLLVVAARPYLTWARYRLHTTYPECEGRWGTSISSVLIRVSVAAPLAKAVASLPHDADPRSGHTWAECPRHSWQDPDRSGQAARATHTSLKPSRCYAQGGSVNMTSMYDATVPVVENRPLTGGHFLLSLYSPRQAQATRAGQFAMLRLLGRSDVLLRRPMSIFDVMPRSADGRSSRNSVLITAGSSSGDRHPVATARPVGVWSAAAGNHRPGKHHTHQHPVPAKPEMIRLLYKVVGRGTRLMAELRPGDRVGLLAPLGHGFFAEEYMEQARAADEVLHVAGGIGIAALLLPARELARAGIPQRLFFGGRTKADLIGMDEFTISAGAMVLATEDGSEGHRGYVTRPLEKYLGRRRNKRFLLMVCGPWAMLEASAESARKYGHPCLVSMENRMGCALGVCLGCSIRVFGEGHGAYERVCTEGPVFWADKVVWRKEPTPTP